MSHKHAKILEEIFADPPSGNIHWRDVESLLHHLNAETASHGAMLHVKLGGADGMVHRPHHSGTLSKQDVRHLRGLLSAAGVAP
jgi:hypothetical protein